jgi:hypothetical protein
VLGGRFRFTNSKIVTGLRLLNDSLKPFATNVHLHASAFGRSRRLGALLGDADQRTHNPGGTFQPRSGRTRAPSGCLAMQAIKPSGLEKILSRKASTAPFGPTSMRSTLARRHKAERREARADFRVGTALRAVAHPALADRSIPRFEPRCKPNMRRMIA